MKHLNPPSAIVLMIILLFIKGDMVRGQSGGFDLKNDLLLVQYDFKTDVDDLHSAAAFATLLKNPDFKDLNYHAVAGAYGTQKGLYVPPNSLMIRAFGDNWSDAHNDFGKALAKVLDKALNTLNNNGDVWIAEGGQSDFSAALVRAIRSRAPDLDTGNRVHLVQHSSWNEQVTFPDHLNYVKTHTDYQKIPDGNGLGNGTPGFRSGKPIDLAKYITDREVMAIWDLAIDLGNHYNGFEGRYLNKAVAAGGLDFSDFSEVCWILGLDGLEVGEDYFREYVKND